MIDSAQWWLYEQTSFGQLSEIYRAEEFMGPREAHVQNEKEPPSPLFFHPSTTILYPPRTAPPAAMVPTLSSDALEPDIHQQRRLSDTSACSPPAGSVGCVVRQTGSFQNL